MNLRGVRACLAAGAHTGETTLRHELFQLPNVRGWTLLSRGRCSSCGGVAVVETNYPLEEKPPEMMQAQNEVALRAMFAAPYADT